VAESKVVCLSILVEPTDGAPFVFVDVTIDCPLCGTTKVQIHGHHLRQLRDFLIQTIDQYPGLTGRDGPPPEVTRLQGPGNDPGTS
jgi:hypothetical protein